MDAPGVPVPVRWWEDGGFAPPPAALARAAPTRAAPMSAACPASTMPGAFAFAFASVHVVGVRNQPDRATARRTIRAALLAALADATGVPAGRIVLCGGPGEAPTARLDDGRRHVHLSISHDGDLAVAALRLDGGAVGVDLMRVADVPDWQAVACDYLGPACADALARVPAPARAAAFARAWSEREARLKCRGLALTEWAGGADVGLAPEPCWPLAVPDGYAGSLALPPA